MDERYLIFAALVFIVVGSVVVGLSGIGVAKPDEENVENPGDVIGGCDTGVIGEPSGKLDGEVCTMIWAPVCGVNGVTYGNECMAGGMEIAHESEC